MNGDQAHTLLRSRRTIAKVWAIFGGLGVLSLTGAVVSGGGLRLLAVLGAALSLVVLPAGFLLGSRVRALTIDRAGVRLHGVGLRHVLPWLRVTAVDFRTKGPTVFLVRTVDFDGGYPAIREKIRSAVPGSVPVGTP